MPLQPVCNRLSFLRPQYSLLAIACSLLVSTTGWGFGLAGDQVQGTLSIPTTPSTGNYFTIGPNGTPTSSSATSAIVGPGVEFGYYSFSSQYSWQITADISDNRITINERLSIFAPASFSIFAITPWTVRLTGLDWAGSPGIASTRVVSQDPSITLQSQFAHSVTFNIAEIWLYDPPAPYSTSRTTVIELVPIPEPSSLALCGVAVGVGLIRRRR